VHLRFILAQLPARVKWNKHAAARLFRLPQSLTDPAKNGKLYLKKTQMEASMKKHFFRILSCCVLLACLCALVVFVIARVYKERYVAREKMIEQINNVFDAVGLGVFAVSGARIGMEAGFADNMFLTTFLGATTAIGGGMLRDVLLREMPFVLKKRVYAVAAILGALGYALLLRAGVGEIMAYGLGMIITTAVRILATVFKWNMPQAKL